LIAKVRIDEFRNWGNVVFASSTKLNERGNFIWQITKRGELHFLLKSSPNKRAETFGSTPVFKRRFFGTWVEIAVVADAKEKKIYHYLDGQQISVHEWTKPVRLITDQASIGNLFDQRGLVNDRFLGGSISELLIYKRALSGKELAARHAADKNNQ
ncbi:MAG: hypothetical protein PHQ75_02020, partial [Thermoguttaceae bacterium]|nr:hypothetical protein [Thermoguttaceae bacterium]